MDDDDLNWNGPAARPSPHGHVVDEPAAAADEALSAADAKHEGVASGEAGRCRVGIGAALMQEQRSWWAIQSGTTAGKSRCNRCGSSRCRSGPA